ncbi:MAG TPA: hypothetical protein VK145_03065 [Candidatus Nanoarchaeia archaeon]|nr:hypothetical protein [Candidatus Nanoarchaeia archaeon]
MNPESENFKDEDIAKIASDLTKQNRKQFGETFKSAANRLGTDPEPQPVIGNPISTRINQLVPPATVISSLSDDSQLTPEKRELYSIVKPLRTYERDVAESIRSKNESVASVKIAAEQKRIEQIKVDPPVVTRTEQAARKGIFFILSIVLILAGVAFGGLLLHFFLTRPPAVVTTQNVSIISTDSKQQIDITGRSTAEINEQIQQALVQMTGTNKIIRIDLAEKNTVISSERFFEIFGENAPSSLGRALGDEWVLGYQIAAKNEPFIFTTVSSFDNAYDGMLRFEQNIAKDFGPIFIKSGTVLANGTSTEPKFEDLVVKSKDTRVLKDRLGNIVLLYSFVDSQHLVITTNEATFRELLNRYIAAQIVR